MPSVPGLRSPHAPVGRLVYFGRMLDKIRLFQRGALPAEYHANLGEPMPRLFDARCCRFLRVSYTALRERTLLGGADEEILSWAETTGGRREDEDVQIWNRFMAKLGWRDDRSEALQQRVQDAGLAGRGIETFFDLIEVDEERAAFGAPGWQPARPLRVLVVMGVTGSGKSTLGRELAAQLGWTFADADDFHPSTNVEKMRAGQPLTDADRAPWLAALRQHLDHTVAGGQAVVLACSALREGYRQTLAHDLGHTRFLHLRGDEALLRQRLAARAGHFAKADLLPSQFATLETPLDALAVDYAWSTAEQVASVRSRLFL